MNDNIKHPAAHRLGEVIGIALSISTRLVIAAAAIKYLLF